MERRRTLALMKVAVAVMAAPHERFYGYPLAKVSGVRSGVLYPMLDRFLADGWVTDAWELPHETATKKPRRYYTLTDRGRRELGAVAAQAEVAGVAGLGWAP